MDNKKYIWSRRYKDNNTHKNAQNNTKKENNFKVKSNSKLIKNENKSFSKTIENTNISVNNYDNAKIRKFNSYSAKVRYKTKDNNGIDGFYVTPIFNIPKRYITIKVPENQIIEEPNGDYHIENITFQISPKKYSYKPYKQPNRKFKLKPQPKYYQNNKNKYYSNYLANSKRKKY